MADFIAIFVDVCCIYVVNDFHLHCCNVYWLAADKKLPGAGRRSEYYRKHGNPNFGGQLMLVDLFICNSLDALVTLFSL